MMNYMFDGGWLWMIFGFLLFVLFWGGIIWLIVWAVKRTTGHGQGATGTMASQNALEIAKLRYAKGEISREQFEQMKKDVT